MNREPEESCDTRIWCEECKRSDYTTEGEKYLCVSCGKLLNKGEHEVHHEVFPHVVGDKDILY